MLTFRGVFGPGVALMAALACNNPTSKETPCTSAFPDVTIEATDAPGFDPPSVLVNRGQRVCWENLGRNFHSVTADLAADSINHVLQPGVAFAQAFDSVRDFRYHCRFHNERGVLQIR